MDFTFSEEQLGFADAVRRFLVVEAAPEQLREYWESPTGRSPEMRQKVTEQGITALSVPEEFGGMGLGDLDWVLILQQVGYHGIPDSLADAAYVAVGILNALPTDSPLRQEWLPRMVEGRARIALSHPINPFVHDAEIADLVLVWEQDELHALPPSAIQTRLNESIDQSRRLYHMEMQLDTSTRACAADVGARIWLDAVDRAALAVSAQLLGLAQRMLDLSVDYAAQRKQFGKAIGSFQAVKHHMADVAVKIEFAAPVVYRAAYALAHGQADRSVCVSHAKVAATQAALLAARKGIQVHGAMGYTWEADLQMFMKRAWALAGSWGDLGFHKQRVADFVLAADAQLGPAQTFGS